MAPPARPEMAPRPSPPRSCPLVTVLCNVLTLLGSAQLVPRALAETNVIFGPGPNWKHCGHVDHSTWVGVDIDPAYGAIIVNFNVNFTGLPLPSNSVGAIYASHVFEHIAIPVFPSVMRECYRVLKPGGWMRVITPNPRVTMEHYLRGDAGFSLFKRRRIIQANRGSRDWTLFELLRLDFLSFSKQTAFLGENGLAHQNAWDNVTMIKDFVRAGFSRTKVHESHFRQSKSPLFSFEGAPGCRTEADEFERSLYVEGQKTRQ